MEALRSSSEDRKRSFFFAQKNKESLEKEIKESVDMFMMKKEKKS